MRMISILPKNEELNIRTVDVEIPNEDFLPHPDRHNMFCGTCRREDYPECREKCPWGYDEED